MITYMIVVCRTTYSTSAFGLQTKGYDPCKKIFYTSHGLQRSLSTVPSLSQDSLHGTAFPTLWRTCHLWRHSNPSSKPNFLNSSRTAIKSLNSCTASFPSASAVLRRYRNRLVIISMYMFFHIHMSSLSTGKVISLAVFFGSTSGTWS